MEKLLYFELEIQQDMMTTKTIHVGMKCHQLQPKRTMEIFISLYGLNAMIGYQTSMEKISGKGCNDNTKIFTNQDYTEYTVSYSLTPIKSIPVRFRQWISIEIIHYRTYGYINPMIDIKVDGETAFIGESTIDKIKNAHFYFGNTGSNKKSADVAVSNFELTALTPMPFEGLPQAFKIQDFGHALDIDEIPSTKTKLGF